MNSEKSKISVPPTLLLNLPDEIDLRRKGKYIASSNFGIHYTWKTIKMSYKNNKFEIPAPIWNEEFELPDGSYSVSDIEDCFEHTLKRYGKKQLILQQEYTQIKLKIESRLKLKLEFFLSFQLLRE